MRTVAWRMFGQSMSPSWMLPSVAIRSPSVSATMRLRPHGGTGLVAHHVGPDDHPLEASGAVGRHHGDIHRVAPAPDRHASDARSVEARVVRPPAIAEVHLEPRVEVHGRVRARDAD